MEHKFPRSRTPQRALYILADRPDVLMDRFHGSTDTLMSKAEGVDFPSHKWTFNPKVLFFLATALLIDR